MEEQEDTSGEEGVVSRLDVPDSARDTPRQKAMKRDRRISGNLAKKPKKWRPFGGDLLTRSFEVKDGRFFYEGNKEKWDYKLEEISVTKVDVKTDPKKNRFAFEVTTPKGKILLFGSSEQERENWMTQLVPRKTGEGDAGPDSIIEGVFSELEVGQTHTFTLIGIDRFGSQCIEGNNVITATVQHQDTSTLPVDVKDLMDGTYRLSFKTTVAGPALLNILVEGNNINGSPFKMEIIPGKPDSGKSRVVSTNQEEEIKKEKSSKTKKPKEEKSEIVSGVPQSVEIEICDEFGNRVHKWKGEPTIRILDKKGKEKKEVEYSCTRIKGEGDGGWKVTYTPNLVGPLCLAAEIDGKTITGFPIEVVVTYGPPSLKKTKITGEGIKNASIYQTSEFQVSVEDEAGNLCDEGADVKAYVTLDGSDGEEKFGVVVKQTGNGIFSGTYCPDKSGAFLLHITLNGKPVPKSPFKLEIARAPADPKNCTAEGPGLAGAETGDEVSFRVITRDLHGNKCKQGSKVEVYVTRGSDSGVGKLSAEEFRNKISAEDPENIFEVKFAVNVPGKEYWLHVLVDGEEIGKSPFHLEVGRAPPSLDHSKCDWDPKKEINVMMPYTFTLNVIDVKGKPYEDLCEAELQYTSTTTPSLPTTDIVEITIEDKCNGTVFAKFIPKKSGTFRMVPTIKKQPLKGSETIVTVLPGPPVVKGSKVVGEGLSPTVEIYKSTGFRVIVGDEWGNPVPGVVPVGKIVDYYQREIPVKVSPSPDGPNIFDFSYLPETYGQFSLSVLIDKESFGEFPITINSGPPTKENSIISGDGTKQGIIYRQSEFTVTLLDDHNNPAPSDPPTVKVTDPDGEDVAVQVTAAEYHVFSVSYQIEKKGDHTVKVLVKDQLYGEYKFHVDPAPPSPACSKVSGDLKGEVYKETQLFVHILDERGKEIVSEQKVEFFLTEKGFDKQLEAGVKAEFEGNGKYKVLFVPIDGGNLWAHVSVNGEPLGESPYVVVIKPAQADLTKCAISGKDLPLKDTTKDLEIYGETNFSVTIKDSKGNPARFSDWKVNFGDNVKKVDMEITEPARDGVYFVSVTPKQPGLLVMQVVVDGVHLEGSPFSFRVSEAEVSPKNCFARGDGLKTAKSFSRGDFTIHLCDKKDKPCPHGNIEVTFEGLVFMEDYTVSWDHTKDKRGGGAEGVYWVRFNSKKHGNFEMNVKVNGEHIKDSPFKVQIEEGIDLNNFKASEGFPRLIRISGRGQNTNSTLVECTPNSLNLTDVFILDNERVVYQIGENSNMFLKQKASHITKAMDYDRGRRFQVQINYLVNIYEDEHAPQFWRLLGVQGDPPKSLPEKNADPGLGTFMVEVQEDASSGETWFEVVGEGDALTLKMFLDIDKVVVFDTGFEVYIYEGKRTSESIKNYARDKAGQDYIKQYERPSYIIINRILSENAMIKHFLK